MAGNTISLTTSGARWRALRAYGLRAAAAAAWLALAAPAPAPTPPAPVKGDVRVQTDGGYARIVFRLDEQVESKVHLSGTVLVVDFKTPIEVSVDRINAIAPGYVSAARIDPDGKAIRIALVRGYRINSNVAGERLYVDILPTDWKGVLPGLPQDIIDELSRRTREAERQLRQQRLFSKNREQSTIIVKVGTQPTFTRYIFELPPFANVVPERADGKLTLNFDQPIKYDLSDVKATMPSTLQSVDSEIEHDSVAVTFQFNGQPDVRLFREDRSVVVDIDNGGKANKPEMTENGLVQTEGDGGVKVPALTAPDTVPAPKSDETPKEAAPKAAASEPAAKAPGMKDGMAKEGAPVTVPQGGEKAMAREPPPTAPTLPKKPDAAPAMPVTPPAKDDRSEMRAPAAPGAAMMAPSTAPPAAADAKPEIKPEMNPEAKAVTEPAAKPPMKLAAKPAEMAPPPASPPPVMAAPAPPGDGKLVVDAVLKGDILQLSFPYNTPTPAAAFRRADTLWLVFDSDAALDVGNVPTAPGRVIRGITVEHSGPNETVVRIKLERPRLVTLVPRGNAWDLSIGDKVTEPIAPLTIARTVLDNGLANITIPVVQPKQIHRITDPEVGDKLLVVTALGPPRGFLKPQNFVELRALVSAHGVVIQPIADDVMAELAPDKVSIGRPRGLSLSSTTVSSAQTANNYRPLTFDTQTWGFDRQADFQLRQSELMGNAAGATEIKRRAARLDLARFYLARDLVTEAKAVIDVVLQDQRSNNDDVTGMVMKVIANVMLDRPEDALKDLANPVVGDQLDAPAWRAVALAKQGKWADAREGFKSSEGLIGTMPIELQRLVMVSALRTYIEARDFTAASKIVNEFEAVGTTHELEPAIKVLTGRLNEALGKKEEAVALYRSASDSSDRKSAAQGRLRELLLRYKMDEIKRSDMIAELEKLTAAWRGDETEAEGLKNLAHFYTRDARYRDAFHVMRVALLAHANSDITRQIHDEAAATFDSLFLGGKGDALPPIEALGLFYDYRDLTPIGRRGDEMIRRLAERLVAVDLLEQAAELLDYQVTHRLQGAARAQVATRLAVVYLMNRKPDRALAALRQTRISGLATDLRNQRLLLEARAMSSIGRHELGLEIIANMQGKEVIRLRSDIYWAAKRWREAAEQIELLYGDRWKDFAPLTEAERGDILRATLGYALAEDGIGLKAFTEKYGAKMLEGAARRSFEIVSAGSDINNPEFRDVAATVAAQDTLGAFLNAIKARYPESASRPAEPGEPMPPVPENMPGLKPGQPQASAPKTVTPPSPQGEPVTAPGQRSDNAKSDPASTGSIDVGRRGMILPPVPPKGVRLNPVPPPAAGVPRLPRNP